MNLKESWPMGTFFWADGFTLQGTNISPKNGILKMIFLFPRWDMSIPWRISIFCCVISCHFDQARHALRMLSVWSKQQMAVASRSRTSSMTWDSDRCGSLFHKPNMTQQYPTMIWYDYKWSTKHSQYFTIQKRQFIIYTLTIRHADMLHVWKKKFCLLVLPARLPWRADRVGPGTYE